VYRNGTVGFALHYLSVLLEVIARMAICPISEETTLEELVGEFS